jgi:hypothetical protein
MDQVQNAGHGKAKCPIHDDEKQARKQDHQDNERSRNQRFAPGGPSHFASLGTDLLQEFEGVRHCVDALERLDIAPAGGGASQTGPPVNRRTAPSLAGRGAERITSRAREATGQAAPYNQACGKRKFISDEPKCDALPAVHPDSG